MSGVVESMILARFRGWDLLPGFPGKTVITFACQRTGCGSEMDGVIIQIPPREMYQSV